MAGWFKMSICLLDLQCHWDFLRKRLGSSPTLRRLEFTKSRALRQIGSISLERTLLVMAICF